MTETANTISVEALKASDPQLSPGWALCYPQAFTAGRVEFEICLQVKTAIGAPLPTACELPCEWERRM